MDITANANSFAARDASYGVARRITVGSRVTLTEDTRSGPLMLSRGATGTLRRYVHAGFNGIRAYVLLDADGDWAGAEVEVSAGLLDEPAA